MGTAVRRSSVSSGRRCHGAPRAGIVGRSRRHLCRKLCVLTCVRSPHLPPAAAAQHSRTPLPPPPPDPPSLDLPDDQLRGLINAAVDMTSVLMSNVRAGRVSCVDWAKEHTHVGASAPAAEGLHRRHTAPIIDGPSGADPCGSNGSGSREPGANPSSGNHGADRVTSPGDSRRAARSAPDSEWAGPGRSAAGSGVWWLVGGGTPGAAADSARARVDMERTMAATTPPETGCSTTEGQVDVVKWVYKALTPGCVDYNGGGFMGCVPCAAAV